MSICTGRAVRHELPVCCEDTRLTLAVKSKPLAGLLSIALPCTFIGSSCWLPRYESSIDSGERHELDLRISCNNVLKRIAYLALGTKHSSLKQEMSPDLQLAHSEVLSSSQLE